MAGKIIDPRVNIPPRFQQGDSVTWDDFPFEDIDGVLYQSSGYALVYTIAGTNAPVTVTATALGTGWTSALSIAQSANVAAGKNWWQAQLMATGFAATVAKGELWVDANLVGQSAGYSGLSLAEQNLNTCKAAAAALSGSNGAAVKSYRIGDREMTYRDIAEIFQMIDRLQAEVNNERTASSIAQNQGNPRKLYARFPGGRAF